MLSHSTSTINDPGTAPPSVSTFKNTYLPNIRAERSKSTVRTEEGKNLNTSLEEVELIVTIK